MISSIKSHNILSELYKIFYSRSTQIVLPIVFILQPLLSYISSKQILTVGLNATPETNSSLAESIPPSNKIFCYKCIYFCCIVCFNLFIYCKCTVWFRERGIEPSDTE